MLSFLAQEITSYQCKGAVNTVTVGWKPTVATFLHYFRSRVVVGHGA